MLKQRHSKTDEYSHLLNRPLLACDLLPSLSANNIQMLVDEYQRSHLPTMNGGFAYSNLVEGPQHALTCLPYRLWEYASLFTVLDSTYSGKRFLDVGGAASPLVFFLAEKGYQGVSVDLQPLLVDLTNYVASVRSLPLQGYRGDITCDFKEWSDKFDFVTFISVLEHIPRPKRATAFQNIHRLLKPGGFLYMTFDYGQYYTERTTYLRHEQQTEMVTESIHDLDELANLLLSCGFEWIGNDIVELPSKLRNSVQAPCAKEILRQRALNVGPVDGHTPWHVLLKYVVQRVSGYSNAGVGRFGSHNFFRVFLRKC